MLQQHPDRHAQRTGQVRRRGVHTHHQIHQRGQGGGVAEILDLRVVHVQRRQGRGVGDADVFLQHVQFGIDAGESGEEGRRRNGALGVFGVRRVAGDGDADAPPLPLTQPGQPEGEVGGRGVQIGDVGGDAGQVGAESAGQAEQRAVQVERRRGVAMPDHRVGQPGQQCHQRRLHL